MLTVPFRLLLLFALLSVHVHTQATTLCLNCASTFNGYCVSCNTGGCAPYATLDTACTSHSSQPSAIATPCTTSRKLPPAIPTVIAAMSAASHVRDPEPRVV